VVTPALLSPSLLAFTPGALGDRFETAGVMLLNGAPTYLLAAFQHHELVAAWRRVRGA
jgi:hypothetical protein